MLPEAKLDILLAHHASLEAQLLGQVNSESYVRITRELAELNPLIDAVKAYRAANAEIAGIDALISDPATEPDMRAMAEAERETLQARSVELAQQIRVALLPKDAMDDRNVVLEIRAGTGGDEASLFAGDLFRMYERFAGLQGWKVEVVSASEGTVGGFKEIIAEVQGRGAFAKLKFESGVHRVQRVPDTETQGRIHTSAATVAVLPEVDYLVSKLLNATAARLFLGDIARGEYHVEWGRQEDVRRANELTRQYADLELGLVDAAVMAVAERLSAQTIATFDRRHFGAVILQTALTLWP